MGSTNYPKYNTFVNVLKINGYTDQFIKSCQRTTAPTNQSQTHKGLATLLYIQGTSEKIARTLDQFNINVAHKLKKLNTNLVNTYDQPG